MDTTVRVKLSMKEFDTIVGHHPDVSDLSWVVSYMDTLLGVDQAASVKEVLEAAPSWVEYADLFDIPIEEANSLLDLRRMFVGKFNEEVTKIRNGQAA